MAKRQDLERTDGSWVNEKGNTCIGTEYMRAEATPESLLFVFDREACPPEIRETLTASFHKGATFSVKNYNYWAGWFAARHEPEPLSLWKRLRQRAGRWGSE